MIETEPRTKTIVREQFGPGKAGELAYLALAQGIPCENTLTHEEKRMANRTIGFDVSANYEFIAVCSDECEDIVKKTVEKDLLRIGQLPSFDRNGFGRA